MTPFVAELIGTMILILLGNGVVANVLLTDTKGHGSGWIVITTGWALAVYAGVVIATPFSGAHLNPAVTVGLAIAGKFDWSRVVHFVAAQMAGAMLGAVIVWIFYRDHFGRTDSPSAKLACFCTGPNIRNPFSNLLGEIIATFALLFVIFHFTSAEMGPDRVPVGLGSLGALPVAFLVWGIGLSLGGTTGYALNPARDLGPRLMHELLPIRSKSGSDWGYAWIPVAGPLIGAAIAAFMYLKLSVS